MRTTAMSERVIVITTLTPREVEDKLTSAGIFSASISSDEFQQILSSGKHRRLSFAAYLVELMNEIVRMDDPEAKWSLDVLLRAVAEGPDV